MARDQKLHGHTRGGRPSWRNYGVPMTATKTARAEMLVGSGESWWMRFANGERRDAEYMAETERRFPNKGGVDDWRPGRKRRGVVA